MNFTDVFVAGLFCLCLWQEYRLRLLEHDRGSADSLEDKEYQMTVEHVILRPESAQESYALLLWERMCRGKIHSRRHMAARRILTEHNWNQASALIRQAGVHISTHTHEQGVRAIREAEDRYHKLAQQGVYVSPHGQPY